MVAAGPRVSLIATLLNEMPTVTEWWDALLAQTRLPDEIVLVDGGSSDGTCEALSAAAGMAPLPVIILRAPGCTIARGRNLAIERASGDIIAVTDAGTMAHPDWLAELLDALDDERIDVASGFFEPLATSIWERALAAATLPDRREIEGETFQPSSRSVAFRASWYRAGLRYPEWLDYCEDLVWDLQMRRAGARFVFSPQAVVAFHVRPNVRLFAMQYLRYARGDGKAGLFALRHALRYATYVILAVALLRRRRWEALGSAALGALYVRESLRRLWRRDQARRLPASARLAAAPLVVGLRALGDASKMIGYPLGLWWRLHHFGSLGWRTTWRRITPSGQLRRP